METLNSNHLMGKFEKFISNHLKFERFFIVLDMCSNRLVPTTFGLFELSLKYFRTDWRKWVSFNGSVCFFAPPFRLQLKER